MSLWANFLGSALPLLAVRLSETRCNPYPNAQTLNPKPEAPGASSNADPNHTLNPRRTSSPEPGPHQVRLRRNPAVTSAPLMTTIIDSTGLYG